MISFKEKVLDNLSFFLLCLRQQYGRRFLLIPLIVLVWPIYNLVLLFESGQVSFSASDAQNELIGLPIYLLSIGLGVGIIAKEIEKRTLEVAYTIPGSAQRLWVLKLLAASAIIVLSEMLLAVITYLFFTDFSFGVLYRVFQGALFFLVVSIAFGALMRNELAAGLMSALILIAIFPSFHDKRWSPLFDPTSIDASELSQTVPWLIQNHIGIGLLILGVLSLAFYRAERREVLLE